MITPVTKGGSIDTLNGSSIGAEIVSRNPDMTLCDSDEIRSAFGCFATGVSVATTSRADGGPVGMTISSFNTVSVDPPLVLWSIARDTACFETFSQADFFAVHVLGDHQKHLSIRFANSDQEKFANTYCGTGLNGVPILPEFAACFECSTEHRYPGGDHMIIVGRVLRFKGRSIEPLIFHNGEYSSKGSAID